MGGGNLPLSDQMLAALFNDLKTQYTALRADFLGHKHGSSTSYVQNDIHTSGTPVISISGDTSTAIAAASMPTPPTEGRMGITLSSVATLLNELKADLNLLRTDMRTHDHGGSDSYSSTTIRAGQAPVVSGTVTAGAVAAADLPTTIVTDDRLS